MGRAGTPRTACGAPVPLESSIGCRTVYGYQYGERQGGGRSGGTQKQGGFRLGDFLKDVAVGAVTGGLASAAFYGAGKAVQALKDSVRANKGGSNPKNVFPENPDDFLPEISRNKVTKPNGTTNQTIQTSDRIRIRAEQHPLLLDETYNPRHQGVHYHVEYKVDPVKGWNNKSNVKKCYPNGYTPGAGSGFIPGETFPE